MKSVDEFQDFKDSGKKISMVTCYDFWSAQIIDNSDIDAVLVGDSTAMVMHGYENTINATEEMMAIHTAAVRKGIKDKFIISDLPFLSHRKGREKLMNSVDSLFKAGAHAVKLEGTYKIIDDIEYLTKIGIPVMGHLGMTPQSVHQFGGFKLQGKTDQVANSIIEEAKHLQDAGCFSIVLEMIPENLAKVITEELTIPTIGIGAGRYTSGQILVLHDLLGMNKNFNPKFVRKYIDGYSLISKSLDRYNADVKNELFPSDSETFK